jgi:hypothetical protein
MTNFTTQKPYDEDRAQIVQDLKNLLLSHKRCGQKLSDEELDRYLKEHDELNDLKEGMESDCEEYFDLWMQKIIGPVTSDHLTDLMNEEICLLLQSDFLRPGSCHFTCKELERDRLEMAELPVEANELNVARYALLRNLLEKKNGRFVLEKHKGICYVYNNRKNLTITAKEDFVRFGYMLRLINDKLTELEKKQGVEAVSEKPDVVQPAPVEADEEPKDKAQPVNLVFKKFHEGKAIDFCAIRKCIEERLVCGIKRQYEWYAAYRIADDLKLLEDMKLSSFAEQMNKWFPNAEVPCDAEAFGDYATGHTGMNFSRWNEETFLAEKKNNQTQKGFRKLWNLCHEMKDALKIIPTL